MSKISVITPVYNTENYLCRCVESILAQSFSDFELILIDDGSTDNSGAICDDYAERDNRIRVFHQENKGQGAARNLALDWVYAYSNSEYISFVDSDDWVHPRYLELLYTALVKYNANISQSQHINTDGSKEIPAISEETICVTVEEQYLNWYSGIVCEKLYSKKCFQSIRFPEGVLYEDTAIWYKLLFAEQHIAISKAVLYYYFINPKGTVQAEWKPEKFARIIAWDQQIKFISSYGNENILNNAVVRYCHVIHEQYLEVEGSTGITIDTKKHYKNKRRMRIRRMLHKHRQSFSKDEYRYYYAWVNPRLNWCYWTVVGMGNKVKRMLRINGEK